MKRISALILAACLLASMASCKNNDTPQVTEKPGVTDTKPGEQNPASKLDGMTLEAIAEQVANRSGLELGKFFGGMEITGKEDVAFELGMETFNYDFTEAYQYGSFNGSIPFAMVLFRMPAGTDLTAFTADIKAHCNLDKWICVSADKAETAISGQTVLFIMAKNDEVDAMVKAFGEVDPDNYNPDDYGPAEVDPLDEMSMEGLFWELSTKYEALPMTGAGAVTAESGYGLSAVDASCFKDSYAAYNTDAGTLVAMFRLDEGVDMPAFLTYLREKLDLGTLGENRNVLIMYKGEVAVVTVAADESANRVLTDTLMLDYQMTDDLANFPD